MRSVRTTCHCGSGPVCLKPLWKPLVSAAMASLAPTAAGTSGAKTLRRWRKIWTHSLQRNFSSPPEASGEARLAAIFCLLGTTGGPCLSAPRATGCLGPLPWRQMCLPRTNTKQLYVHPFMCRFRGFDESRYSCLCATLTLTGLSVHTRGAWRVYHVRQRGG